MATADRRQFDWEELRLTRSAGLLPPHELPSPARRDLASSPSHSGDRAPGMAPMYMMTWRDESPVPAGRALIETAEGIAAMPRTSTPSACVGPRTRRYRQGTEHRGHQNGDNISRHMGHACCWVRDGRAAASAAPKTWHWLHLDADGPEDQRGRMADGALHAAHPEAAGCGHDVVAALSDAARRPREELAVGSTGSGRRGCCPGRRGRLRSRVISARGAAVALAADAFSMCDALAAFPRPRTG